MKNLLKYPPVLVFCLIVLARGAVAVFQGSGGKMACPLEEILPAPTERENSLHPLGYFDAENLDCLDQTSRATSKKWKSIQESNLVSILLRSASAYGGCIHDKSSERSAERSAKVDRNAGACDAKLEDASQPISSKRKSAGLSDWA